MGNISAMTCNTKKSITFIN